jgi:pyridoxine kinase
MQKTCAAIHDLASYAKSSLTVVLPALEALGVEVSPLPTALLSSQSDGFDSYFFQPLTEEMRAIIAEWQKLDLMFDSIYAGFLGSAEQVSLITEFIHFHRARKNPPLVLVDPVMGDDGDLYGPMEEEHIDAMKKLITEADYICPNVTEAALLLGYPYQESFDEQTILRWAKELANQSNATVAITSVPVDGKMAVACSDADGSYLVCYDQVDASYPGSGDLFASILLAYLLNKDSFRLSVTKAAQLTALAIRKTQSLGHPYRRGVSVTSITGELAMNRIESKQA